MELKKNMVVAKVEEKFVELVANGEVDLVHTETMMEVYERALAGLALKTTLMDVEKQRKEKMEAEISNLREAVKVKKDIITTIKDKVKSFDVVV